MGKYGPEKSPYFDTFHAVTVIILFRIRLIIIAISFKFLKSYKERESAIKYYAISIIKFLITDKYTFFWKMLPNGYRSNLIFSMQLKDESFYHVKTS